MTPQPRPRPGTWQVELVKNRLQSSSLRGPDSSGDEIFAYKGLADGLLTVLRTEGVSGLYAGCVIRCDVCGLI